MVARVNSRCLVGMKRKVRGSMHEVSRETTAKAGVFQIHAYMKQTVSQVVIKHKVTKPAI
ncbi:predicted protein [Sclerotinia sclerotiorum 1980 UF-70]|uniref:Uncharacterized protein n=1 Tax=Sclerotinia sclerotiorum (strain ATCC 18683 / 1980 / Ss-1) TaxID=665079 RepID=A7EFJ0_SCLS1|nr:predicted protein [Sclerotinia sclerotiorum 1980 UF-70]EDO01606.1 predicted protein [Sclerotinia sclerotiorum 1980 UF-70]